MSVGRSGELDWFALYYDPIEEAMCAIPGPSSAISALAVTPYLLPQDPQFTTKLYELAIRGLGWGDRGKPVVQLLDDPRGLSIALFIANELGDDELADRLRVVAEREFEPRFFGPDGDSFGWWFGFGEEYPRGQPGALLALSEIGARGSWQRAFKPSDGARFREPTVEGVEYPTLGISQAYNDPGSRSLIVETYAATSGRRGHRTSFRVTQSAGVNEVAVTCDGEDFASWRAVDGDTIEIATDVADHVFRISTADGVPSGRPVRDAAAEERTAAPGPQSTPTHADPPPAATSGGLAQQRCACC